jgi:thiol-disulfide isomerase/thioredoxin
LKVIGIPRIVYSVIMTLTIPAALLRWDWVLFTATTTAFVAHMYYLNNDSILLRNKKARSSRPMKQVSFRLDKTEIQPTIPLLHSSLSDVLPSIDFGASPPKMIGLLFAAKWCPDCTNVVPAIGRVMDAVDQDLLKVIYISSDTDEMSIQQFKPSSMLHIPHSAVEERTRIKQQYSTCAAKEMGALQIPSRKHGIPTLILINALTGTILSEDGVEDVMDPATTDQQVLDRWKGLLVD